MDQMSIATKEIVIRNDHDDIVGIYILVETL